MFCVHKFARLKIFLFLSSYMLYSHQQPSPSLCIKNNAFAVSYFIFKQNSEVVTEKSKEADF